METKICSKCGRELPLECFGKDKSKKDGLCCSCKECVSQRNKRYNAEHADEIATYNKQWKAEHPNYDKQHNAERYATIEGYAYAIRCRNLRADREQGRCGKDEDLLPSLEYYVWALQQPDYYDGKQYPFNKMGLDRIYNDKPHTFANVVPCSTVNNRRRQRKSFEEFCKIMKNNMED